MSSTIPWTGILWVWIIISSVLRSMLAVFAGFKDERISVPSSEKFPMTKMIVRDSNKTR